MISMAIYCRLSWKTIVSAFQSLSTWWMIQQVYYGCQTLKSKWIKKRWWLYISWHALLFFFSYDSKKETGFVGLKNQGATCYMNSLFQSLYCTNAFRKAVYQIPTEIDNPTESIALAMQRLFHKLQFTNNAVGKMRIYPISFTARYSNHWYRHCGSDKVVQVESIGYINATRCSRVQSPSSRQIGGKDDSMSSQGIVFIGWL